MRIHIMMVAIALGACGGGDRPIEIPVVPTGDYEADCQALCTLAADEDICGATHAEFCLASCRVRTNGLPATCAQCLIDQGTAIAGYVDGFDEAYCDTGGAADITACATECDDGGAGAPASELDALCELECAFYMQDADALACSDDGSGPCLGECRTAIAERPRVCAQCLADQTQPSRICINDDCDCEPYFDSDESFGCSSLCDDAL